VTTRAEGLRTVGRVLRAKLFELRATPSAWWLAAGTAGYGVAVVVLLLALLDVVAEDEGALRALLASSGGGGALLVLFGIVFAAGEYRHRTIIPLVLAEPRRLPALTGQLAAYAVAGLITGLVATSASLVVAFGWLSARGDPFVLGAGAVVAIVAGGAVHAAVGAVLGGSVGTLLRNQVAAAIAVFVYLAMVDPVLAQAVPAYGRFGPTALGIALSGGVPAPGGPGQRLLPWPLAAMVWGGTAVLCAVAAAAVTRRREIS